MSVATSSVNCVLLLGAGASAHAGYPVTNRFFKIIEDRIDDESVQETLEFFTENPGIKNLDELFRNIHGLSSLTGDEEPAVKFLELQWESVLSEVELSDSDCSKIKDVSDSYRQFLKNCTKLREEFVESFHQKFSWNNELEGGYDALDRYVKILQRRNNDNHPVFTTNYDPTVESLVSNDWTVNTLFDQTGRWEGEAEHVVGRQSLNLFKLHGSITWARTDRGLFEIPPGFTPNVEPDQERELILPGRGMGTNRQRDPYNTHWRLLDTHLDSADACVVVGHRLADEELGATLERHDTEIIMVNSDKDVDEHAEIDDFSHVPLKMQDEEAYQRVEELLDRFGVGK